MNKRLFVAGLPFSTTEDELRNYFQSVGNVVSATIISDRMTGRSKGFGFVEMETEEEAQNAITKLNKTEFGGRSLVVSEAKPMEDRQRPSRSGGGYRDHSRGGFSGQRRSFGRGHEGGRSGFGRGRGSGSGGRSFKGGRH